MFRRPRFRAFPLLTAIALLLPHLAALAADDFGAKIENVLNSLESAYDSRPPYGLIFEDEVLLFDGPNEPSGSGTYYTYKIWRDGDRISQDWTRESITNGKREPDYAKRSLWTGEQYQFRQQYLGQDNSAVLALVSSDPDKTQQKRLTVDSNSGKFLDTIIPGDLTLRLVPLLRTAKEIKLSSNTEDIDGNACISLEATTTHGTYKLWLDPNSRHMLRRAEVTKKPGDFYYGSKLETGGQQNTDDRLSEIKIVIKDIAIDLVDGHLMPVAGVMTVDRINVGGEIMRIRHRGRRSEIIWNPDFEAQGAFVMDGIPDGSIVVNDDFPGLPYLWENGRAVPDMGEDIAAEIDRILAETLAPVIEEAVSVSEPVSNSTPKSGTPDQAEPTPTGAPLYYVGVALFLAGLALFIYARVRRS